MQSQAAETSALSLAGKVGSARDRAIPDYDLKALLYSVIQHTGSRFGPDRLTGSLIGLPDFGWIDYRRRRFRCGWKQIV